MVEGIFFVGSFGSFVHSFKVRLNHATNSLQFRSNSAPSRRERFEDSVSIVARGQLLYEARLLSDCSNMDCREV